MWAAAAEACRQVQSTFSPEGGAKTSGIAEGEEVKRNMVPL